MNMRELGLGFRRPVPLIWRVSAHNQPAGVPLAYLHGMGYGVWGFQKNLELRASGVRRVHVHVRDFKEPTLSVRRNGVRAAQHSRCCWHVFRGGSSTAWAASARGDLDPMEHSAMPQSTARTGQGHMHTTALAACQAVYLSGTTSAVWWILWAGKGRGKVWGGECIPFGGGSKKPKTWRLKVEMRPGQLR